MSNHGNEAENGSGTGEERPEPVIRDNRKVDPETGQARSAGSTEHDADAAGTDALGQAEEILNAAAADAPESEPAASSNEAAELRTDLQRLQAEYVNYRKRVERDRAVAGEMAVIGVLNALLPVMDDIDAARAHGDLADGPFASIAGKLENALKAYGLERIEETDVEFDPNIHEALIQQPGEVQTDTVSQVLRAGYRTQARVLRAAQVIVAVPQ